MKNVRLVFEKLKNYGIELLNPVQKPVVSNGNSYKKNFDILFKKASPELKQIITEKKDCKQFNDFAQQVIELSENE